MAAVLVSVGVATALEACNAASSWSIALENDRNSIGGIMNFGLRWNEVPMWDQNSVCQNHPGMIGSILQNCEQPSPDTMLPSSQPSPGSSLPLPHRLPIRQLGWQPSLGI